MVKLLIWLMANCPYFAYTLFLKKLLSITARIIAKFGIVGSIDLKSRFSMVLTYL